MSADQPGLFSREPQAARFDCNAMRNLEGPTAARPVQERSNTTLAGHVAAYFEARPNQWIDGRDLMGIAGAYGWRTRVSDIRRPPYSLRIDNRQRRVGRYIISEYMLVEDSAGVAGE